MKSIYIVFFLVLTLISCGTESSPDIEWTKGGQLHKATAMEWRRATEANKLATCADFCANIKVAKGEKYQSLTEMKNDATIMMTCIDEALKGNVVSDQEKVSDLAVTCKALTQ